MEQALSIMRIQERHISRDQFVRVWNREVDLPGAAMFATNFLLQHEDEEDCLCCFGAGWQLSFLFLALHLLHYI